MIRLDMPAPFPKKYLVRFQGETVRKVKTLEDAFSFSLGVMPKDQEFEIVEVITYKCTYRQVPDPLPENCESKHERKARSILTTLRKVNSKHAPR